MRTKKVMWLLVASGALLLTLTVDYAKATDANGNKFRHLPIRWCALAGSPTAVTPGSVDPDNPGADTTTVLWRRHERVSDRIYLRLSAVDATNDVVPVTFRSADSMETSLKVRTFPIINGPNTNGDFNIDPNNPKSLEDLIQACDDAWGSTAPGIPVINVNHLFYNGTQIGGRGSSHWSCPAGSSTQHTTWTVDKNWVLIADRSYNANGTQDANLLGHELGHALNLFHTAAADSQNLMTLQAILDSDPPHVLSTSIQDGVDQTNTSLSCSGTTTTFITPMPRTINQVEWHQGEAKKWPGNGIDPPDTLITAILPSFQLLDALGDVPSTEGFVDLSAVRVSGDVPGGILHVSFRLVGQIPQTATPIDYFFLADLDNNSATGGGPLFPSDLDLPSSSVSGIELIVRARAQRTGPNEFPVFTVTPTVWLFQGGAFQKQASGFATAFIEQNDVTGEHPLPPTFGYVEVVFPLTIPTGSVRVQAITHDSNPTTETVDKLDDTDTGVVGSLAPPHFPVCGVSPGQVQPGVEANVTAHGLVPKAMAKVVLGDLMLLGTTTDANGNLNTNFTVPSDTQLGRRLMTVGSVGTALEADCALDVEGTPAIPVAIPVDINPTSCPNPLNTGKQGTVPVAILGTASLNVRQLDPASIRLAGIAPSKFAYQDVATPYSPYIGKTGANACTSLGPDGFLDLSMSFDATKIAAALGSVTNGQVVTVSLTGNFLPQYGGGPVIGEDVVVIKSK